MTPLLSLKRRVLEVLGSTRLDPANYPEGKMLSEVTLNRVIASRKQRCVVIQPRGGLTALCYGTAIRAALDAAGIKYRYDIYSPQTEGRWVGYASACYVWIPLDQTTGPWGYRD
jgi:hypothetical protein